MSVPRLTSSRAWGPKIRDAYRLRVRRGREVLWLSFLIGSKSSGEAIAAVESHAGYKVLTVEYVKL